MKLLNAKYGDRRELKALREKFESSGYVYLESLLNSEVFASCFREVMDLKRVAVKRSFIMPGIRTIRRLHTVGGVSIQKNAPQARALYDHSEMLNFLRQVTGGSIFKCRHKEELIVANYLLEPGATHGWHLDDPDFALIISFEAPPVNSGGQLEFIPRWRELEKERKQGQTINQLIAMAGSRRLIEREHHQAGDAYLLYASQILHRVSPLTRADCRRSVINLAYQRHRTTSYGETASLLYGSEMQTDLRSRKRPNGWRLRV